MLLFDQTRTDTDYTVVELVDVCTSTDSSYLLFSIRFTYMMFTISNCVFQQPLIVAKFRPQDETLYVIVYLKISVLYSL